jgi:hypothetical protein
LGVTKVGPEHIAAVIVELVQGEGGFTVMPPAYLKALQQTCQEDGILLILAKWERHDVLLWKINDYDDNLLIFKSLFCVQSTGFDNPASRIKHCFDLKSVHFHQLKNSTTRIWFPESKLKPLMTENDELISIFVASIRTAGNKNK